jgi:hypothetical protein
MNEHLTEIDKLKSFCSLRKKFLNEKIKYFKTLIQEKKEIPNNNIFNINNTIISGVDLINNFTSFSMVNKSEYNTNLYMETNENICRTTKKNLFKVEVSNDVKIIIMLKIGFFQIYIPERKYRNRGN